MSTVHRASGMPFSLFRGECRDCQLQLPEFTAELIARPMLAMLEATMPTSTMHCTPLPIVPSPMSSRRPLTVWSPSTLICVVVSCGGVPVHVAAARDAVAASSPITDTRPFTPAEHKASTLMLVAQKEAARESLVARLPTQAPRIPPFTWQASSDSPSRGEGQVRMMALMSSPMPTALTKASRTLKLHWAVPARAKPSCRL
mmetsp:Transcript_43449/g.103510  ORF Transcript_43449/g.103510 Transcript_43449/m.103510 type:complete len:201 (+) Transcript_43449:632-1234(+)